MRENEVPPSSLLIREGELVTKNMWRVEVPYTFFTFVFAGSYALWLPPTIETELFYFINVVDGFLKLCRVSRMHYILGCMPYRGTTDGPQSWEKCAHQNIMKFRKGKYRQPATKEEHQAPKHTGGQLAKNQLAERVLEVLLKNLINVAWQQRSPRAPGMHY